MLTTCSQLLGEGQRHEKKVGDLSETNLLNLKFLRLKRLDKASRLVRRPVANVIKLFTDVSYAFSGAPL
jgi:hypothetical protein